MKSHLFAGNRVPEAQGCSVQELSLGSTVQFPGPGPERPPDPLPPFPTVYSIPHHRVPQMGQVDPDLMGPPRL